MERAEALAGARVHSAALSIPPQLNAVRYAAKEDHVSDREFTDADATWVRDYVEGIRGALLPRLEAHAVRFRDYLRLIQRLTAARDAVLASGWGVFSAIDEAHNELCVAVAILETTSPAVLSVRYEEPLPGTAKSIDFTVELPDGIKCLVDVKTIAPATRDRGDQYARAMMERWLPPQTLITLQKEWLGGEIWHDKVAARSRMLEYTLELEGKVSEASLHGEGSCVVLLLCSNGYHWHEDELEDFADFYRHRVHRADDPFAQMEKRHLKEKGIVLSGAVRAFAYLERRSGEVFPHHLQWRVVPPPAFLGRLDGRSEN